jgi:hypothetical protein
MSLPHAMLVDWMATWQDAALWSRQEATQHLYELRDTLAPLLLPGSLKDWAVGDCLLRIGSTFDGGAAYLLITAIYNDGTPAGAGFQLIGFSVGKQQIRLRNWRITLGSLERFSKSWARDSAGQPYPPIFRRL